MCAKTLTDYAPGTIANLSDNHLVYLVDPALGVQGDVVVTLGTLKQYLGVFLSPIPSPDPNLPPPIGTVATPYFTPVAGVITDVTSVTIQCGTSGAVIHYTTDGSAPTSSSPIYSSPVVVSATTTLKAIAVKSGLTDSSIGSATYTLNAGGGSATPGTGGTLGGNNRTGFISLYNSPKAEYPRSYVSSRMPVRIGTLRTVAAGGDVQAALNAAQPGDWVVTEAAATFTQANLNFPYKAGDALSGGDNVIVVTTSAFTSLPEKVRVTNLTNNAYFTNIRGNSTSNVEPLTFANGTQGWRIVGWDIGVTNAVTSLTRLIRVGNDNTIQTTTALAPKNIIFDRCRIDGHSTLNLRRAFDWQGIHCGIINCWFGDEIHHNGSDCQSISSYNTPGPLKIVNNRICAATEGVAFGGSTCAIGPVADVELKYNLITRPMAWRTMSAPVWFVKNVLETKKVVRLWAEGNIFENNWSAGQIGVVLLLKDEQYGDGAIGHTQDLIFTNNILRNSASGFEIAGTDSDGTEISYPVKRVVLSHNLCYNIATAANNNGSFYFQGFNNQDVVISHVTMMGDGAAANGIVLTAGANNINGDGLNDRLSIKDCIIGPSAYSVKGGGTGVGIPTLAAFAPSYQFSRNIVVMNGGSGSFPSDCFLPVNTAGVGFTNVGADDYSLSNTSLYKGQSDGGTDPGCNVAQVLAATAFAVSGDTTTMQT